MSLRGNSIFVRHPIIHKEIKNYIKNNFKLKLI